MGGWRRGACVSVGGVCGCGVVCSGVREKKQRKKDKPKKRERTETEKKTKKEKEEIFF